MENNMNVLMLDLINFDPEAIHIMVPGETEEEFDARLESYEEEE